MPTRRTVICALNTTDAKRFAAELRIDQRDIVLAEPRKLRGLTGFRVGVTDQFANHPDSHEVWALVRERAARESLMLPDVPVFATLYEPVA